MSTITSFETTFQEAATYGGVADAIGGIATVILAIVALSGVNQSMLGGIATIVFGAALLIQGGTMLTEYTKLTVPSGMAGTVEEFTGGGGLSALFLVGAAGIVLGVLARHLITDAHRGCGDRLWGCAAAEQQFGVASLPNEAGLLPAGAPRTIWGAEFLASEMAPARQFCSACRVLPRSCLAFSR